MVPDLYSYLKIRILVAGLETFKNINGGYNYSRQVHL